MPHTQNQQLFNVTHFSSLFAQNLGVRMSKNFGRHTTALEVLEGIDLRDKTVLITGANNGIGFETARAVALHNAHVVMACRDLKSAEERKLEILREKSDSRIDVIYFDCSSLKTVQSCAELYITKNWPLNILILNAGVYYPPQSLTEDGFEYTFQVNYLAHFFLVLLLTPVILRSKPARVVHVSSTFHEYGSFDANCVTLDYLSPSDPQHIPNALTTYCRSKFCQVLFSNELQRRLASKGVTSNSLHPGAVRSRITRNSFFKIFYYLPFIGVERVISADKGAATTVHCATALELEGIGGKYFDVVKEADMHPMALCEETSRKLWQLSEEMIVKWKQNRTNSLHDFDHTII